MNIDSIATSQTPKLAYVGESISDTATVTGNSPTGTVIFTLYGNASGTGTPLYTSPAETLVSGVATSSAYVPTAAGTVYWVAAYGGDTNNAAVSSGPAAEPVNIDSIATSQTPKLAYVGQSISDTATVTGNSPTGTVIFTLYGNASGTGTPLYTSPAETLVGGVATSSAYVPTAAGTVYWVAAYGGDTNNAAVSSGPAAEPVNIDSIATSQTPKLAYVGQSISDTATVTGNSPTGTVIFTLYGNASGTGTPLYTSPAETLVGGVATSPAYAPTAAGTVYWVAAYGGDANNAAVSSGPAAEPVNIEASNIVIATDKSPTMPQSVEVINANTGTVVTQFVPYAATFQGGIRIATGDLSNSGTDDIATAPGRGGLPIIKVYSQTGTLLTQFQAYPSSVNGGLQVAVADVDGDGLPDIITVPSYGPAEVRVFRNLGVVNGVPTFNAAQPYRDFLAFPSSFIGGAVVAAADMGSTVNNKFVNTLDGKAEIVVGSGAGMKTTVEVFDVSHMTTLTPTVQAVPVASFTPFSTATTTFQGGVSLSVARLSTSPIPDIVVGTGANGRSLVNAWGWNTATATLSSLSAANSSGFAAFTDPSRNAPIQVAADASGTVIADAIYAVQGPGGTASQVVKLEILNTSPFTLSSPAAIPGNYPGPYNIAAIDGVLSSLPMAAPLATSSASAAAALASTNTQKKAQQAAAQLPSWYFAMLGR